MGGACPGGFQPPSPLPLFTVVPLNQQASGKGPSEAWAVVWSLPVLHAWCLFVVTELWGGGGVCVRVCVSLYMRTCVYICVYVDACVCAPVCPLMPSHGEFPCVVWGG